MTSIIYAKLKCLHLQILAELFVEFLEVIFVFTDVIKQFKTFLDKVLANDLEDLALLQSLTGDV